MSPYHTDEHPSASIVGDGSNCRLYCHVCEKYWDRFDLLDIVKNKIAGTSFREANGKKPSNLKSPHIIPKTYNTLNEALASVGRYDEVYKYTNPETNEVDLCIVRINL